MPPITGDFLDAASRSEFLQRIEINQRADAQAVIVELIPDIGFIESAIVIIGEPFIHGITAGLLDVVVNDAALDAIDEKGIAKAYKELKKQRSPEEEVESEGVVKELQSL